MNGGKTQVSSVLQEGKHFCWKHLAQFTTRFHRPKTYPEIPGFGFLFRINVLSICWSLYSVSKLALQCNLKPCPSCLCKKKKENIFAKKVSNSFLAKVIAKSFRNSPAWCDILKAPALKYFHNSKSLSLVQTFRFSSWI